MKISEKVKAGQLLVSDGAWGTFLQKKGLSGGECPESWNISRPDDVFDIPSAYIKAGADMVETNTFGANYFKLKMYGLESKVAEYNKASAELSRRAAGSDKHVLGSVGPTGKLLMMGEVTEQELYDAFKEQCIALEAGGADAIIAETMSDIEETKIAVRAAKENTRCEVIVTMTFEKAPDGQFFSMMGVSPTQMVQELLPLGVDIVGANCGNGIEGMMTIVKEIRSVNKNIPVLVHANAGLPILKDGVTVFPESPEQMASYVKGLVIAGANIIGGCCGTTPEHIAAMAAVLKKK